jgi:ComF family protein
MELLSFLFPKKCLTCSKVNLYVCPECLSKVNHAKQICVACGKASVAGFTHRRCQKPLGLDRMIFLWQYQGVIRQALIKYKYQFVKEISFELADNIEKYLKNKKTLLPTNLALVTIPLHKKRKNWRGYNQVEIIGELLADRFKWNFYPNLLIKKTAKKPQIELKGKQRKANVRGTFTFNHKLNSKIKKDSLVVIFDDVYTTGATIKEAAKVIKRNQVKAVWGLTIAR